jgi:hypothetical protein
MAITTELATSIDTEIRKWEKNDRHKQPALLSTTSCLLIFADAKKRERLTLPYLQTVNQDHQG